MKRLLLLLAALSITALATAGPAGFTIGLSIWTETFDGGHEGAVGNLLDANGPITFDGDVNVYNLWIDDAKNQGGVANTDPSSLNTSGLHNTRVGSITIVFLIFGLISNLSTIRILIRSMIHRSQNLSSSDKVSIKMALGIE
jgi:hypothetical protein